MKKFGRGRPPKEVDQTSFTGQIGAIIRATREKVGKSVDECAKVAEVSVPAWYHFEAGRHLATEKLPRIAKALGVKTRSLIPSDSPG